MSQGLTGAICDSAWNYQTPASGFSLTLGDNDWHVILQPAAGLATGTIVMAANPKNGQVINIRSTQAITALTISPNAGQAVLGAPTTLALGGIIEAIYLAPAFTWYF